MANVDRKSFPLLLIAFAAIGSAVLYNRVPSMVRLSLDGLLPWSTATSGPVPRWLALSLLPVLALLLWAAFRLAPTVAGQRLGRRVFDQAPPEISDPAQFERFGKTYDTIVFAVVLLITGIQAAVVAAVLGGSMFGARIVSATFGLSLVLLGNVVPRLRPNWVAGLRTRRLLADPQLWRRVHRIFGRAIVGAGTLTIVTALLAPKYGIVVGILGMVVACVVGFVASVRPGDGDFA